MDINYKNLKDNQVWVPNERFTKSQSKKEETKIVREYTDLKKKIE